jgi:hypothetical protein
MTAGKISARTIDRLKNEVYRQMLRLEAGYGAAGSLLCVALLQAWSAFEAQPFECECRRWLRRISPVCIGMIAPGCLRDRAASPPRERMATPAAKTSLERARNNDEA